MSRELKLGLGLGYWSGGPPAGAAEAVVEADRLGLDSILVVVVFGLGIAGLFVIPHH